MDVIEKDEFFELNTQNRIEGIKLIVKNLRTREEWDKGRAVQLLREEDIYSQKKDCKDFIKNIIRASNTEVCSVGCRKIALTGQKMVTN